MSDQTAAAPAAGKTAAGKTAGRQATEAGPGRAAPPPSSGGAFSSLKDLATRNMRQSGIYFAFVVIVALFWITTDGLSLSPGT